MLGLWLKHSHQSWVQISTHHDSGLRNAKSGELNFAFETMLLFLLVLYLCEFQETVILWGGGTNWTKFGVVSELKSSPCHLAPASFSRDVVEHLSFVFFPSWVCPTASPPHKFSTIYQYHHPQSPCSTTLAPSEVILRGWITDHLKVKAKGLGSDNKQYYKNRTNKHFFP